MGRLEGRVAVISGGGRGIGRAIGLEMAREGADIVISSRTRDELDGVVAEVQRWAATAWRFRPMPWTATRRAPSQPVPSTASATSTSSSTTSGVAARATAHDHDPFTHDDDVFVDNLTLNLITHYWLSRALLPHMRERGFGRIINIGSGYAIRSGGTLSYTTSKHGIVGFTRELARQTAPYGITVNCLCPGWTNTR